jgi:phosphoribosylformylglycinamidine cyclo-ligase
VDIEAGDRAVELMRAAVARTARPEVIGGIGGFAGLFDASKLASYRRPVLATATDGVGTKVTIAQRAGRYGTWSRWWWTTWWCAGPSRCS